MRTRLEIEDENRQLINEIANENIQAGKNGEPGDHVLRNITEQTNVNTAQILEVLLDIRDLLIVKTEAL